MAKRNLPDKNAEQLDKLRVNAGVRQEKIVREQERIVEVSNNGIDKINSDLKALRKRLEAYTKPKSIGKYDEKYYRLTDTYENKLAERSMLERARQVAQESITAAKLHVIPGEFDRSEY